MKHTLKVTLALIAFFFLAQVVGLLIVSQYIDHKKTIEAREIVYKPLPYNLERPQVENQSYSFIYITIAIIFGTILILLLIRFNKPNIWRFWFFATVWLTLSIAFASFINTIAAAVLALVVAVLKIYRPNILLQNISEIFIYGGLAAIFVPIINIFAAVMLLIVISIYDFIAVFKTKHMVKLAEFQSSSKIFAGLLIPYERGKVSIKSQMPSKTKVKIEKSSGKAASKQSVAVLGGGDIGFTLIFAGVVMKSLMFQDTFLVGFLKTLIIPVFVTIALFILLMKGQQNKFYPAMPVLSIGCFIGYAVVWLI
ncbi:MAG: presenilin family intramembrane aspartyl protease [Nanoarchaeota archaeon]